MTPDDLIRAAVPDDREAIIALITRVYGDYGERLCLEDADADLLDVPGCYHHRGGDFVVLTLDGKVVGCHAAHPIEQDGLCTFRRLYLSPDFRGRGFGQRLMDWAVLWARQNGFRRVEFWSDTRFREAHAFFTRYGFQTERQTRRMSDGWEPYEEFFFWLDLPPAAG